MSSGVNVNNPTVVAAFRAALVHQGIIALLIFAVLGLGWLMLRAWLPTASAAAGAEGAGGLTAPVLAAPVLAEPRWRQLLRIGFGLLWVLDGILQAQPKMAIGLPSQVIEPLAAASPHWVQVVANWAGTTWSYHPLQAGASAVWIQIGIGVWLLAASHGPLSRLAALASMGWGLVVWVFGEAFGSIFAPGLTWLFGAPGAVLIYVVAGGLIALPERMWYSRRLGPAALGGTGLFLIGMAVLQAWPGRQFWQGTVHGQPGTLAAMTASMAPTPQPHVVSAWINAFTAFDEAHGFAVNLFVVVALTAIGAAFMTGRRRLAGPAVIAFTVICLADWVLIEDLGFFGGLGTDPNSMIPFALLAIGGYLALAPATAPAPVVAPASAAGSPVTEPPVAPSATGPVEQPVTVAAAGPAGPGWRDRLRPATLRQALAAGWWDRLRPATLRRTIAAASFQSVAAIGAVGLIVLGAAPMAAAQANRNADPILAESIAGSTTPLNYAAPGFALTDQHGQPVSLASLRGKVVVLTFLDPVCTSTCPIIAQEMRAAGQLLGAASRKVELVAVVANPVYYQVGVVQAFDRQESLDQVPNWLYLTGSLAQLRQVWKAYGIVAEILPAGTMIGHTEVAYVIDQHGRVRVELNSDPGPGSTATMSSFAVLLADAARQALRSS
jgi:cytochrome oxidase Cu insertion factor (SCO1/SenC/PrrC family)